MKLAIAIIMISISGLMTSAYASLPPTTSESETQLIWNCTKPNPQTQCFTKVLENGTLYVSDGKPSHEVTPSNGRFRALDVDEFDVPSETGEDVETSSGGETENCGGEPCTPTEKEDSWTDEEVGASKGGSGTSSGDGESRENLGSKLCRAIDTNQGLANILARGLGYPGAEQAALEICSAMAD